MNIPKIVPEITVIYNPIIIEKVKVICSMDAYVLFMDYFPVSTIAVQERVVAMYLDHANQVRAFKRIASTFC